MIIHKAIYKEDKIFYLCNQAVGINEDKLTDHWEDVTCKNCLKTEYLLDSQIINWYAYYGEHMEMALWVNDKGVIRYYYYIHMSMPAFFGVKL